MTSTQDSDDDERRPSTTSTNTNGRQRRAAMVMGSVRRSQRCLIFTILDDPVSIGASVGGDVHDQSARRLLT